MRLYAAAPCYVWATGLLAEIGWVLHLRAARTYPAAAVLALFRRADYPGRPIKRWSGNGGRPTGDISRFSPRIDRIFSGEALNPFFGAQDEEFSEFRSR